MSEGENPQHVDGEPQGHGSEPNLGDLPEIAWIDEPRAKSGLIAPISEPTQTVEFQRESTRSQLALWLMALLSLIVVALLVLGGLQMRGTVHTAQVSVKDLGQLVLTPIVTLTGTALGFYYGTQSQTNANANSGPPPRAPGAIRRVFRAVW